ncbi:hypothetical protein [Sandarakinorhabdus sp. DWP1-3-1]|uniref:hypothetical protein n=1 Tax=Sandarakinorhabdus sp. DWP1-3-1 TaxID=2804627 RepID=UPI003CE67B27
MAEQPKDKAQDEDEDRDNVMGIRSGAGPDQYGGSFAGGQSGGGAYANAHGTGTGKDKPIRGGQSEQGYYGGGQAGADSDSGDDHHAASRRDAPDDDAASYRDHPSQQGGKARADFDASIERDVGNHDLEGEALEPGDRVQGSDSRPVTGKP